METAKTVLTNWGIPKEFQVQRLKLGRRTFDEVDDDRRLNITQDSLRIKGFHSVIDTEIFQLDNRFHGLKKLIDYFDFFKFFFIG